MRIRDARGRKDGEQEELEGAASSQLRWRGKARRNLEICEGSDWLARILKASEILA